MHVTNYQARGPPSLKSQVSSFEVKRTSERTLRYTDETHSFFIRFTTSILWLGKGPGDWWTQNLCWLQMVNAIPLHALPDWHSLFAEYQHKHLKSLKYWQKRKHEERESIKSKHDFNYLLWYQENGVIMDRLLSCTQIMTTLLLYLKK